MLSRSRPFLLAGIALAPSLAPLAAQQHQLVGGPASVAGSTGIVEVAGGTVAAGPDYEAVLRAGSVEFWPALGDRTLRPLPLRFTLESVRRGGQVVVDVPKGAPATARHDRTSVWYDRGAGVIERYTVLAEGLEQTFEFAGPLPGSGDLVVRGRVVTDLAATAADGGILFSRAGVGGVRFGAVTGIDAAGRRAPGSLRLDGDVLELVLPASLVDDACYPLVLDPLIGTAFEATGPVGALHDDLESDVAYDAASDRYLVVWRRKLAVTTSLIRGQLLDGVGNPVGGTLLFTTALIGVQKHPRVANVRSRGRFLVAWEQSLAFGGSRDIRGIAVDAATGSLSSPVFLVQSPEDDHGPCLGGEATTSDDDALLAWVERNTVGTSTIRAQQVQLPASGDPIPFGAIVNLGTGLDVAISKSGGSAGRYAISSHHHVSVGFGFDTVIRAQGITRNASPIGSPVDLQVSGRYDPITAVDGDGSSLLWVYERNGIVCRRLSLSSTGLAMSRLEQPIATAPNVEEVEPDVCYLGGKYAVFWVEEDPNLLDDVHGAIVNPDCTLCGAPFLVSGINSPGYDTSFQPRCIGQYAGSTIGGDEGLLVFSQSQSTAPFESNVVGQRFAGLGQGSPPLVLAPGCGLGGNAGTSGPFVLGNSGFHFTLTGAQPAAIVFLSLALPGAPIVCGSCGLTAPLSFEWKANVGGRATSSLPVPCDPGFVGLPVDFQWVSFNTSASPCPQAAGLSASQRLRITVGN